MTNMWITNQIQGVCNDVSVRARVCECVLCVCMFVCVRIICIVLFIEMV